MTIDAHAHIFDALRGRVGAGLIRPLSGGKERIGGGRAIRFLPPLAGEVRFSPEMLLEHMDHAGVRKAVLLQGPFYGDQNDYVLQAVRRWPKRLVGAAYLDPWSKHPREDFERLVIRMGFRIVKLELSEATGLAGLHPGLRIDDPRLAWFWEEAQRRQIVVALDLGRVGGKAYQTRSIARLVGRYAHLNIVIAHLAQPPLAAPDHPRLDILWQEQVRLARHPSVWLDLASLPAYAIAAGEDYPYPSARHYLRRAVALAGAEKILWGSDIPAALLNDTYPQLLGWVTRHCTFLSRSDLAKILGENAGTVYGLST